MATVSIDHVAQAASRLLWQLRDKPAFKGLVQSIAAEISEIGAQFAALRALTIATETGAQLDADGTLVGVDRAGLVDVEYRGALLAQIRINRGQGTVADVLFALASAETAGSFELTEPEPATVYVDLLSSPPQYSSGPTLAALLDRLTGAGIRHYLFYGTAPASNRFTLSTDDTLQTSTSLGLGNDASTTGGYLTEVAT